MAERQKGGGGGVLGGGACIINALLGAEGFVRGVGIGTLEGLCRLLEIHHTDN